MSEEPSQAMDDKIDLVALVKVVWNKRNLLIGMTVGWMLLGFLVAIVSPKEFTASSTFIPQSNDSSRTGGSLGGLASLAGINLGGIGGNSSDISPSLYPKFVSSVKFRKALLQAEITLEGDNRPVTYAHYYENIAKPGPLELIKKYTIGLPYRVLELVKKEEISISSASEGDHLIRLTDKEVGHFKRLETQLSVVPNEKDGLVVLSFKMPEPVMAAQMAKFAEELLQKEIIEYRIQNAKEQLKFTEQRFLEKKKEFEDAQSRLSYFRDRNQNLSSATILNQLQKLESEYSFAFSIYTELATQLEQSKLQVAKDTPVLSVINPVIVPSERSAPKRPLILLVFSFIGLLLGLGFIFGSEFLKNIKEDWKKE